MQLSSMLYADSPTYRGFDTLVTAVQPNKCGGFAAEVATVGTASWSYFDGINDVPTPLIKLPEYFNSAGQRCESMNRRENCWDCFYCEGVLPSQKVGCQLPAGGPRQGWPGHPICPDCYEVDKTLEVYLREVYPLSNCIDGLMTKTPHNSPYIVHIHNNTDAGQALLSCAVKQSGQALLRPEDVRTDFVPQPQMGQYRVPSLFALGLGEAGGVPDPLSDLSFAAIRNEYEPEKWWTFKRIQGYKEGEYAEVTHKTAGAETRYGCERKNGGVYNTFFYEALGSGVSFKLPSTISAPNKFGMLTKLFDLSPEQLLHLLRNERFYNGPGAQFGTDCRGGAPDTTTDEPCLRGWINATVEEYATNLSKTAAEVIASLASDTSKDETGIGYCLTRLAMTCGRPLSMTAAELENLSVAAGLDASALRETLLTIRHDGSTVGIDDLIYAGVVAKGLQSYQITAQPNSYGGFAFEIIFVISDDPGTPGLEPQIFFSPPNFGPNLTEAMDLPFALGITPRYPYTQVNDLLFVGDGTLDFPKGTCSDTSVRQCEFVPQPGTGKEENCPFSFGYQCLFCGATAGTPITDACGAPFDGPRPMLADFSSTGGVQRLFT